MRVEYANNQLEKVCTDESQMRRKHSNIADKLRLRLNALHQAQTVGDLATLDPLGRWHSIDSIRPGCWSGWTSRNHRIIIRPEVENVILVAATVVTVEAVGEDYH